jgi:serine kinase of HPr protein (carbohydrate metabolism regulator)
MTEQPVNIHATAIVIGGTGLLFIGPSGAGKSSLAFLCIAAARALGMASALVADDRVLISKKGTEIRAECPPSIAGLMEIRGTGIVHVPNMPAATMHLAVLPVDPATAERLPPEDERIEIADGIFLPAIRLLATSPNPLAIILAKRPIA